MPAVVTPVIKAVNFVALCELAVVLVLVTVFKHQADLERGEGRALETVFNIAHVFESRVEELFCSGRAPLTVPADDLDYVAHDSHLDLIVAKIKDKIAGKDEVVFKPSEVAEVNNYSS